jgi:two-component system LytT family response regulator
LQREVPGLLRTELKIAREIDWIEASGNYLTFHVGAKSRLVRMTMTALEPKLDPGRFARIHRSTIINLDQARELQPWFRGEQMLIMKDGTKLAVGRAFRDRLQNLFYR